MWDGKRVLRPRLRGAGKNDREDDDVTVFLNAALRSGFGLYCTFRSVTTRTPILSAWPLKMGLKKRG